MFLLHSCHPSVAGFYLVLLGRMPSQEESDRWLRDFREAFLMQVEVWYAARGVVGYNVYRSDSGAEGSYALVTAAPVRGDRYLDEGLALGATYWYRLAGVDAHGTESAVNAQASTIVGATRLFMTDMQGDPGHTVKQHVLLGNPSNLTNRSFQVNILHDDAMLAPRNAASSPLTEGFVLTTATLSDPDRLRISAAGDTVQIRGEGPLFEASWGIAGDADYWTFSVLSFGDVTLMDDAEPPNPVAVDATSTAGITVAAAIVPGDLSGDGLVTPADELLLAQIVLGLRGPSEREKRAGDLNGDGALDSADHVLLRRLVAESAAGASDEPAHEWALEWGAQHYTVDFIEVPIVATNLEGVAALDLVIHYDPGDLQMRGVTRGDAAAGFGVWQTNTSDGRVEILAAADASSTAAGQIAVLQFKPQGDWLETTLHVAKVQVNDARGSSLLEAGVVLLEDCVLLRQAGEPTPLPTPTPAATPLPTVTPTDTPTPDALPSPSPSPTPTPTSESPTPLPSPTPGALPSATPTPTPECEGIECVVIHFYNEILQREPSPQEVDGWSVGFFEWLIAQDVDVRFVPSEMGRQFFLSQEYQRRSTDAATFVTDCYNAFLYRDPSQAELDGWGDPANRKETISIFANSVEFQERIAAMFPNMEGNPTRNFVATMYLGLLDRLPDPGGLMYYADEFDVAADKRERAKQMGREVSASDEYAEKRNSNALRVESMYRGYLGRYPNNSETEYWTGQLGSVANTLEDLIEAFADSQEFTERLDQYFGTPTGTITIDATPDSGSWTLSGPVGFASVSGTGDRTGTSAITDAPEGDYTLTCDDNVPGYNAPPPQTRILAGGGTLAFTASWTPEGVGGEEATVYLPGNVPLEMVRVPAGLFQQGRYPGEWYSFDYEDPQHTVNIAYDFWMGKYELTKRQWQAVMGTEPWAGMSYVLNDLDSPAVYVSWSDAQPFIATLNQHLTDTGQTPATMRLPSESDWEYACRAWTTTRFYWGDDPNYTLIDDYAWWNGNTGPVKEYYAHVVGRKLPNAWGLYDMSGNVWEWCQDYWHDNYTGAPTNGSAWEQPTSSYRVIRGGGWGYDTTSCRSAYRDHLYPDMRNYYIGFRLVRSASLP